MCEFSPPFTIRQLAVVEQVHETDTRVRLLATAAALAAIAIALAVYRPFDPRPFEFLDFPEFFGVLERGPALSDRINGLVAYYHGQGRANVLAYVLIAVRWTLFGRNTAVWQLARFLVMCALILLTYVLLRRLGASRTGAAIGASLFLTTEAASHGWLRLSMMEPLATVLIYAAAIIGSRLQRSNHWRIDLVLIAGLVIAAILLKEVIVATVPLIALVGLCVGADGSPSLPCWSKRNATLIISLGVAAGIALVPTMAAVIGLRGSAYAASYGSGPLQPSRIVSFLFATLVPFNVFASSGGLIVFACYVLLTTAGVATIAQHIESRQSRWIPLAIALAVALFGAVAYVPWPSFELFYTIPYLIAPAILLAIAVSAIERAHGRGRAAAYGATLVISAYAISLAHAHARRTAAAQRLVDITAIAISQVPNVDTAVFAVARMHPQAWQGTGPTIARYATAVRHVPFPVAIDVPCATAASRATAAHRTLVVVLSSQCPSPTNASTTMQQVYHHWDWNQGFVRDSLRASLISGTAAAVDASTR